MKKTIVLGSGQLGKTFKRIFPDVEIIESQKFLNHPKGVGDRTPLWINFQYLEPFDTVINTIAVTDTKLCEVDSNYDYVESINADLPSYISNYCLNRNKRFVQISTACVYAESDEPKTEDSELDPLSVYAKTKCQGELKLSKNDLIIRGHLFFSNQSAQSNFLHRIKNYKTFVEELNSFTFIDDIPLAIESLLKNNQSGKFNVACDGIAGVFDVAKYLNFEDIFKVKSSELRLKTNLIIPNIILDTTKIQNFYKPTNLFESIDSCWKEMNL